MNVRRQRATPIKIIFGLLMVINSCRKEVVSAKNYYYTRTRENPNHLRVSEEFKNNYVNEIKYESKINGTKYEYYKSALTMSHDELVFETIDKIFKHRLSPFYVHHYDNDEDKKLSSDPKLVSQEACARDLMYLVDKLPKRSARDPLTNNDEDHLSPELTAFFDSYGRQEAGLMMGNTYWVGAYDQCVNRHIFDLTSAHPSDAKRHQDFLKQPGSPIESNESDMQVVSFNGRYCVSALRSSSWDGIIKDKKVGICLPSSCDSSSYERHSEEIKLLTTSMLEQRYADYELIDLYCLPDESSPLRALKGSALYFVIFVAFWSVLLFLATVADLCEFVDISSEALKSKKPPKVQLLVVWFSLRANYRKLMKVSDEVQPKDEKKSKKNDPPNKLQSSILNDSKSSSDDTSCHNSSSDTISSDRGETNKKTKENVSEDKPVQLQINLRFLNAFKVLIMFWIVNGHIMLLMIQTAKNILNSDALLNGLMHFLIGATFGVDLFFTMTGFLTSYLIFNSGHAYKMKVSTWLYLSFHRYWRLAPMCLLTFWFSRSLMQLLGSGPLWDYGTSSMTFRGLCNYQSWWYPLTLTTNLHGLFEECMITSWYISCDMQFWLVSPIFLHILAKSPLNGWILSLATIAMSSKLRYDAILTDKSAVHDELVQPRADIFMRVSHDLPALYTHPHYRISAYIVGLLAGHYVYMVKSGKWMSSVSKDCLPEGTAAVAETEQSGRTSQVTKGTETLESKPMNKRRSLMAKTGLFLFLVMSFVSYLLSHYYPTSMLRYAKYFAGIAYSVDHLVMSVGASLVIIAMCFGHWSKVVRFLSHPNWTRLSKMNYALLLLQCEAIYYQIFQYEQIPVAGTRELVNILFNLIVTLYPMAFAVTLAFEFPLANIEKLLI